MRFTIWLGVIAFISSIDKGEEMPLTLVGILLAAAVFCVIQDLKEIFK